MPPMTCSTTTVRGAPSLGLLELVSLTFNVDIFNLFNVDIFNLLSTL